MNDVTHRNFPLWNLSVRSVDISSLTELPKLHF